MRAWLSLWWRRLTHRIDPQTILEAHIQAAGARNPDTGGEARIIAWTDGNSVWFSAHGASLGPGTRALVEATPPPPAEGSAAAPPPAEGEK
jgi:hypothetical protein